MGNHTMPLAKKPEDHVAAHPTQPDHADFHEIVFLVEERLFTLPARK